MRTPSDTAAAVIVAAVALTAGCGRPEAVPGAVETFPDAPVVLISIDTLRADHLPAYGYRGVDTPAIDRLARDAILFRHAWSHSPMTLPSHLSMLTARLPAEHGVRDNAGYRFDASSSPYLPCLLREHGYATGAAVSSYVLRSDSGMDACFDLYEDSIDPRADQPFTAYQRPGDRTLEQSVSWVLAHRDRPFLFFFHIYEPHVPYDPPEPYRSRYPSAYDGEIAAADAVVGRLLDVLDEHGILDRAVVVLTSDHGEGLGDHGEEQHSILLYREAIQVPLIIRLPGAARGGTVVEATVRLVDLPCTILELLGLPVPDEVSGPSLVPPPGSPLGDRAVVSETLYPRLHFGWSELTSLVAEGHHYIHGTRPELYDLVDDPAELHDLAGERPDLTERMRRRLEPHLAPAEPRHVTDPDDARALAALGYVGGPGPAVPEGPLPSPRDRIHVLERLRDGLLLNERGRPDEGARVLRGIVADHPGMAEVWTQLAGVLADAGRLEDAAAAYEQAVARSPVVSGDVLVEAGFVLLQLDRVDEAEDLARQAVPGVPAKGHELLARVALARGRLDVAEAEARAAVSAAAALPSSLVVLAEVVQRRGDLRGALAQLDRAEARAAELGSGAVHGLEFLRGDTLARMDRPDDAVGAFERETAAFPHHTRAWAVLALVHLIRGDAGAAQRTLEGMAEANPGPAACELAARTLAEVGAEREAAAWSRRAAEARRP